MDISLPTVHAPEGSDVLKDHFHHRCLSERTKENGVRMVRRPSISRGLIRVRALKEEIFLFADRWGFPRFWVTKGVQSEILERRFLFYLSLKKGLTIFRLLLAVLCDFEEFVIFGLNYILCVLGHLLKLGKKFCLGRLLQWQLQKQGRGPRAPQ